MAIFIKNVTVSVNATCVLKLYKRLPTKANKRKKNIWYFLKVHVRLSENVTYNNTVNTI